MTETEFAPYRRLAAAVIKQAADDLTGKDQFAAAEAAEFFYSASPGWKESREHWFAQAGVSLNTIKRIRARKRVRVKARAA